MRFTVTLKKTVQFKRVYNEGRSSADGFLVLYVRPNNEDVNRLGFSVSKKVGNSVTRSRVTRLIRENYRLMEHRTKPGHDMVVVARKSAAGATFYDIAASLSKLLKRRNVYIQERTE